LDVYLWSYDSALALVRSLLSYAYVSRRALHSFPTRRSSDLRCNGRWAYVAVSGEPGGLVGSVCDFLKLAGFRKSQTLPTSPPGSDRKSTRLNSSHVKISYAVFCLKKKKE